MRKITIVTALPSQALPTPAVSDALTKLAGGVTQYLHEGEWRDEDDVAWCEKGVTYVLYTDADIANEAAEIVRHAYGQTCVMLEVTEVNAHLHYGNLTKEILPRSDTFLMDCGVEPSVPQV